MTYSIIGRDPETGALGVAAQSRWFNLGPQVMFVEHGVGAVATQSFVEPSYGPRGLARMGQGRTSAEALAELTAADAGAPTRQVAMVDAAGRFAQHTGAQCVQACGHTIGANCAAQGNMLASPDAWRAMVAAFESEPGPLAERLVAALAAAEATGGDARGRQSAAIVVRSGPGLLAEVDLRVVDHADPVGELRRLLQRSRAFDALDAGVDLALAGDAAGLERLAEARALAPDEDQVAFWQALALARHGRLDAARSTLAEATAAHPAWADFVGRLVDAGHLPPEARAALLP